MTEDQAMATRCCGASGCGEQDDGGRRYCIASACMAWRWTKIANPAWKPDNMMMSTFPRPNPYSETPAHIYSTTDGRCGLAGQE